MDLSTSVRVPASASEYLPTLKLYYEEEIMGEAYFTGLARYFHKPQQQEKLMLLSSIERCVADAVRPLLDRHGVTPRSDNELHAIGLEEVYRYKNAEWHDFVENILQTFPGYMDEFAALEAIAPKEDISLLEPFTSHEVAGIEFAKKDMLGDPESTQILKDYIRKFPV